MTRRRPTRTNAAFAGFVGFVAGVAFASFLAWQGAAGARPFDRAAVEDCGPGVLDSARPDEAQPGDAPARERVPPGRPPAADVTAGAPPRIGTNPIEDLRNRRLLIPVEGFDRGALRSSFEEPRGTNRVHEAMDLLAPRHTPVLAVDDGTIARLFTSRAGGLTVYHFDPTKTYVYYYAHLERYAPGLTDGSAIRRGQVIGYVGTSGNAPANTPHLHFAIFRLTAEKQWWNGLPVDPFEVLR